MTEPILLRSAQSLLVRLLSVQTAMVHTQLTIEGLTIVPKTNSKVPIVTRIQSEQESHNDAAVNGENTVNYGA